MLMPMRGGLGGDPPSRREHQLALDVVDTCICSAYASTVVVQYMHYLHTLTKRIILVLLVRTVYISTTTASITKKRNVRHTCGIYNGFDADINNSCAVYALFAYVDETHYPCTVSAYSIYQHHRREYYEKEERAPYLRYI